MTKHAFPRSFKASYIEADHGDGIYIYDTKGKSYVDGCCGALVSNLGHNNPEIIAAIKAQYDKIEFAHPSRWHCAVVEEAATAVAETAPGDLDKVWFVSGGSEAVESAVKLARQYYVERDGISTSKSMTIGRWNSYHGSTLGTMSISGSLAKRRIFTPLFKESPKAEPPYCYRCPFYAEYPSCRMACVKNLEHMIRVIGPQYITSFIAEPVSGSMVGAVVPPDEYWPMVRDICTKYDILLIADEVMSGCGRTGKNFAIDNWNVVPDMIATAKGLAAGYVPTGGIVVRNGIADTIRSGSGSFMHGHTYNGNPVSAAAVCAVFKYMKEHGIVENTVAMGKLLEAGLKKIATENAIVGDVRGKGLMWGIELVCEKSTKKPFAQKATASALAGVLCAEKGIIVYPGSGQIDGHEGDTFLVAPPLIINEEQVNELLEKLSEGLALTAKELLK